MRHIVLIGPVGSGRSSMIQRLTDTIRKPVVGFVTSKEDAPCDKELGHPIFLYTLLHGDISNQRILVGHCQNRRCVTVRGAFNRFSAFLPRNTSSDDLIVFDELGIMEVNEHDFCADVLSLFDMDTPILAAIRDIDTPMLQALLRHPKCLCLCIRDDNWEECFQIARSELMSAYALS